jgi:WD40 repeat protein
MKRSMMVFVSLITQLTVYAATSGPAQAEVPGANGQIAFERLAPGQSLDVPGTGAVFVANPDGTHLLQVPLVYPTDVLGTAIDWSPDGTKLLLSHTVRFDSLGNCCLPFRPAVVNPDGSGFKLLTMGYAPFDVNCLVWTTDQKRLLCGFGEGSIGIYSVRASDGGDPVQLTTYPFGPNCNSCDEPTDVSPDGTRFVFLRFLRENTPGEQVGIYVENLDGTGLRQITPYGLAAPREVASAQWSPDGTQIISETTTGHLFTVHPDGTGLRTIRLQVGTGHYFAFQAHWSPDGTRIIFGMSINGGEGIYTADPDGSNVVQITDAPTGFDNAPDWGAHPLAT